MTYIVQFLVAMAATLSFAILFNAPRHELLFCGLSGALSWLVYFALTKADVSPVPACFIATFLLTVFARCIAVIRRTPATVYLLPGIFPLVPGAGIYYTAYYMINEFGHLASSKGLETLEIALAITLGIIFGFAIPQALLHRLSNEKELR